jgi:ribonuclease VapC
MPETAIVLDSSAILALIFGERGASKFSAAMLENAVVSAVNLAEVQTKLVRLGHDPENAWNDALAWVSEVEPYTREQAKISGTLVAQTQSRGLSLGDRSCLALALVLGAPVYTADRLWHGLQVGVEIHIIR